MKKDASKIILCDRIDLIVPSRREELLHDIENRCGIRPVDVEIGNIDFLKEAAYIKIYYKTDGSAPSTIDSIVKGKHFSEAREV